MLLFVAKVGPLRQMATFMHVSPKRTEAQFNTVQRLVHHPDFDYLHTGPAMFSHKDIGDYDGPMYLSWTDLTGRHHMWRIESNGNVSRDEIDPHKNAGKPDPEDVIMFESFVSRGADQQPVVPVSVKRE